MQIVVCGKGRQFPEAEVDKLVVCFGSCRSVLVTEPRFENARRSQNWSIKLEEIELLRADDWSQAFRTFWELPNLFGRLECYLSFLKLSVESERIGLLEWTKKKTKE
jgi:hypothetical protein